MLVQGVLSLIAFMGYIAYSLTRVVREPVGQTPADVGLEYEEVTFPSRVDHLALRGWWIQRSDEERCIILVHGGEKHRADPYIGMLSVARDLAGRGCCVLLFDLRGHGESEGKRSSLGYYERRDLLGAIDYVLNRGIAHHRIGILGFSLGAAIALLVASGDGLGVPVVSDSSFADLPALIKREASRRIDLPGVFNLGWMWMTRAMYGVDLGAIRPVEAIKKLPAGRVLIIHGAEDETVPLADAHTLHDASNNAGDGLWIVPGASHVRSYRTYPEEYVSRVVSFFDQALKT
ncbi:MAG: alpha/beta fold hydrolase [Dehalococcoidia bacterium]